MKFLLKSKNWIEQIRRFLYLKRGVLAIFIVLFLSAVGIQSAMSFTLISTAVDEQRNQLAFLARNEARLIEAVANFDQQYSQKDHAEGNIGATLSQVFDAYKLTMAPDQKVDVVLVRRLNGRFRYLARDGRLLNNATWSAEGQTGRDLINTAFHDKAGTIISQDHRGVIVLAAFERIPLLSLAIIVKIDMEDIRQPYINSAFFNGGIILGILLIGTIIVVLFQKLHVTQLKEKEQDIALAKRVTQFILWEFDLKSGEIRLSDADQKYLGVKSNSKKLTFEDYLNLVHINDKHVFSTAVQAVKNGAKTYNVDYRLNLPNGETRYFIDRGEVFLDEKGMPRLLKSALFDISDDNWAKKVLQDKKNELQQILDATSQGIYGVDSSGNCTFINKTATRQLRYGNPEFVLGRNMHDLIHHTSSDGSLLSILDCNIFKAHRDGVRTHSRKTLLWNADGNSFWAEVWSNPIYQDGNIQGSIVTIQNIDKRMKVETALQDSQALLEAVFNAIPLWVSVKDREYRYLMVNQQTLMDTGLTTEDYLGTHTTSLPLDNEEMQRNYSRDLEVFKTEKKLVTENVTHRLPDGMDHVFRHIKVPFKNEHGEVKGIVTVSLDMTEIRAKEEKLLEDQRLIEAVFDTVPIGIFLKDEKEVYALTNKKLGEMHEFPHMEMVGKTYRELNLCTEIENVRIENEDRKLLNSGEVLHRPRVSDLLKNGKRGWRRVTKSPLFDQKGNIKGLVGAAMDITDLVEAEEELLSHRATLQMAQEISQIGILDWDLTTGSMAWTEEISKIFGNNNDSNQGDIDAFLDTVHPDDRSLVFESIQNAIKEGEPYDITHRVQHSGGEIRYVREKARVYKDETGKAIRVLGVMEDITDYTLTERELKESSDKLLQSNEEMKDFLAIASHDLQEPLRKTLIFSDRLSLSLKDNDNTAVHKYLNGMQKSTMHMSKLTDSLASYYQLTFNKNQSHRSINLSLIIDDIIKRMEPIIEDIGVQFEINEMPVIKGDQEQIRLLLFHLIENSIRFRKPDSPLLIKIYQTGFANKPALELTSNDYTDEKFVRIHISDNGIGFKQQYAEKIFKIFERLHGHRKEGGTGIGLALCRKIVDRHGGSIQAESIIGKGAEFQIILPRDYNHTIN